MSNFGLGSDLAGDDDIGRDLRVERNGRVAIVQWAVRALSTQRLWYDDEWGIDLRQFIGTDTAPSIIETRALNTLLRDERIITARVAATRSSDARRESLTIAIDMVTTEGDLDLTLLVTNLTVELLKEAGQR